MIAEPKQVTWKMRGAAWTLLQQLKGYQGDKRIFEVMIDGPRGTSKTVSVGMMLRSFALWYPGIRMLFVRKTRKSITESFCPDWEQVVCMGVDECLTGAKADQRSAYVWKNGSKLTLQGMDDPHKTYSTSYDLIVVEEAFQFTQDEFAQFRAMLRNWNPHIKWQLLLALTNPRHPKHWLMQRVKDGHMQRLKSRHQDNPKWYDVATGTWTPEGRAYLQSLATARGVLYRRNYKGEWCSAEGAVWEAWDEDTHVIETPPENVKWYCGAMDWGHTDPCAFLVGAVSYTPDKKKVITIVREVYQSKKGITWWANEVVQAYKDFGLPAIVVDPSRPEIVDHFNQELVAQFPALKDYPVARSADNVRHASSPKGDLAGIDLVREYIETSRFRYLKGSMRHGIDVDLKNRGKATGFLEEVVEYVYRVPAGADDARDAIDQTDPKCADHGADCARYLTTFVHSHDFSSLTKRTLPAELPPGEAEEIEFLERWTA